MLEGLAPVDSAPLAWLLTYLLHSTVVLSAVWIVLRTGLVRAPEAREAVWKVGALAGLFTASLGVFGPAPERGGASRPGDARVELRELSAELAGVREILSEGQPAALEGGLRLRAGFARERVSCSSTGSGPPGSAPGRSGSVHIECSAGGEPWSGSLAWIWLAGAVLLGGAGLGARRDVRRALGPMRPAGDRARRARERIDDGRGRAGAVMVSPHVDSPCALGRTLVLPERCERDLSDAELEAVLAHEIAHVVRRDALWLAVFEALTRVLWVQPLNRVARRGFLDAAELACDDWAVARLSSPLDLARSISRVAEWSRPRGRPLPATALARSRTGLAERVRRILRGERGARGGRRLGLALALTLAMPAFALPAVPVARTLEAIVIRRSWQGEVPTTPVPDGQRVRLELRALRTL